MFTVMDLVLHTHRHTIFRLSAYIHELLNLVSVWRCHRPNKWGTIFHGCFLQASYSDAEAQIHLHPSVSVEDLSCLNRQQRTEFHFTHAQLRSAYRAGWILIQFGTHSFQGVKLQSNLWALFLQGTNVKSTAAIPISNPKFTHQIYKNLYRLNLTINFY